MSKNSTASARRSPIAFEMYEQCTCTCCQTAIPRENIVKQIDPKNIGPTRQRVRALCPACDSMFEFIRTLRNNAWEIGSEIERVTDPKRRERFIRRLDAQRGNIQRTPAA
jgi:hypothetical protein